MTPNNSGLYVLSREHASALDFPREPFPLCYRNGATVEQTWMTLNRKVNPRDTTTEQGGSRDTVTRLVLRRGIPFGPSAPRFARHDGERGLLFVASQTSIDSQFEFLQRTWANTEDTPSPGGHDPVIGQSRAENGRRRLTLWLADGRPETVTIAADFVTPTGGGYFFAPSLSALAHVIGRD